ncbi:MAG: ribonuclease HII [Ignavibacteria bacterium]|nr:ribonuclease HII [Ignavibacteria bacterium]
MIICGIDEAGRGPLAGPVVIAAVIMKPGSAIEGVKDSKKLSQKSRESLFPLILADSLFRHVEVLDNITIDESNILKAVMKGMENCINAVEYEGVKFMIDGNYFKLDGGREKEINYETIIKGDDKIYEISCASIIAKVTRDRIMEEYDNEFPQYGFKSNKGYGTKKHIEAIQEHGTCPIHRKTFLKNILIRIPLFKDED